MSEEVTARREVRDVEVNPDARIPEENGTAAKLMPLFSGDESQTLRSRWESLQVGFVDEPRHAVEEADRLVKQAIDGLARGFATEREKLEQQWHRGEDVSTGDLRLALRRYRSFFERLPLDLETAGETHGQGAFALRSVVLAMTDRWTCFAR